MIEKSSSLTSFGDSNTQKSKLTPNYPKNNSNSSPKKRFGRGIHIESQTQELIIRTYK